MTATETEQETETDDLAWQRCSICGGWANVDGQIMRSPNFAHNTCSQLCAIAAAIVEALGALRLTVEAFYGELAEDLAQLPYEPVDGTPT